MTRSIKLKYFTEKHVPYENSINNNKKVYFKLPYIRTFLNATKIKLKQISDKYRKNTIIVVAFSPLKIGSFFSCKDSFLKFLSYIVYQFTCAGCNACYIGETRRHVKTRTEEHLEKDKISQILKHDVIDRGTSHFRLQLKEAMDITWKKPILNKQTKHVTLTLAV